jgi:hypothetical protein
MIGRIRNPVALAIVLAIGILGAMLALGTLTAPAVSADGHCGRDTGKVCGVGDPNVDADGVNAVAGANAAEAYANGYMPQAFATPNEPGAAARYDINFQITEALGVDSTITIEFENEFQVPGALETRHISITGIGMNAAGDDTEFTQSPSDVTVSKSGPSGDAQHAITLTVPDMDPSDEGTSGINAGSDVRVIFAQVSGIKNPLEAWYRWVKIKTSEQMVNVHSRNQYGQTGIYFPRIVKLSSVQSTRGSAFTVTGVGFFKDTSATLWLDENANGVIDTGEVELGEAQVGGDFTFVKTITITNPPFKAGYGVDTNTNFINAVDGRSRSIGRSVEPLMEGKTLDDGYSIPLAEGDMGSGTAPGTTNPNCIAAGGPESCLSVLELRGTILVTPTTAAIGDTVQVTIKDHNSDVNINQHGLMYLGGVAVDISRAGSTTSTGEASFNIRIPEGVPTGVQELNLRNKPPDGNLIRVTRRVNMTISGAVIRMTPDTDLVPNQTVSLSGSGFSIGGQATINGRLSDGNADGSLVSISGNAEGLGSRGNKLNEGDDIEIDNGGNWSASFVIPINDTTTTPGNHVLKIVDSGKREGTVNFTIADRTLVLDPAESRLGTTVQVTGGGYPANNTGEGADFSPVVSLIYLIPGNDISVAQLSPDSSGSIVSSFRVPLRANIPSTNAVRAEFEVDGTPVTTSSTHKVPRATITVTPEEGPIGSIVDIKGEGFKTFSAMQTLELAGIEIPVSPVPSTDNMGSFQARVQIPQVSPGTHGLTVEISRTTASGTFKVSEGPVTPTTPVVTTGDIETVFADQIASGALHSVFHYDNESETFNSFLPDLADIPGGNTYTEASTGNALWVRFLADTTFQGVDYSDGWKLIVLK